MSELPADIIETYFKRVARQCVRDHARPGTIEVMQEAIEAHNREVSRNPLGDGMAIGWYKQLMMDRTDPSWRIECLPWPCVRLNEFGLVHNTLSDCWAFVEVTYGTRGESAIYGITKFDGQVRLWAD